MSNRNRTAIKIILPLLILVIGALCFKMLVSQKKAPQRHKSQQQGVLVDVMPLQARTHQVKVHATGTVVAEQQITLVPEVNGKVVWISPQLVSGGLFKKGQTLLRIDPSDYRLAVEQARAAIASADVALRTEQEKARIALQEWNRIDLPDKGVPGPLVTREIQLQQAQAGLTAARASLKQAQLNLQRTELVAPFDGRISQEQVDLGQYLRAGTSIATFAGTARAEILAPLQLDELRWLKVPMREDGSGSTAIIQLAEDPQQQWQGKVVRSLGEIDPQSRMATLVIAVEDPYQLQNDDGGPILHNGQFVEIVLLGRQLDGVISIPRAALRSGNQVWIADGENRLRNRPVEILRREQQLLLLESGVQAGERLVLTTLSGAADGLLLRPLQQEQAE